MTVPFVKFNVPMVLVPLSVRLPPVRLRFWLKLAAPLTDSAPPETTKFSSEFSCNRPNRPDAYVMVWSPTTLMLTRPEVGTELVFQLAMSLQSPLVPTQQYSTRQPLTVCSVASVAPIAIDIPTKAGALMVAKTPLPLA